MLSLLYNAQAPTEIYTLSLHDRSSDLTRAATSRRWATAASSCASSSVSPTRSARRRARSPSTTRCSERAPGRRSEEHTSELQSRRDLVCRLLLEKKNHNNKT